VDLLSMAEEKVEALAEMLMEMNREYRALEEKVKKDKLSA
jgi:hypothetical protein